MSKELVSRVGLSIGLLIGILLGEKLRVEKKARWILEKRYGYNPYFEPALYYEKDNARCSPWLTKTLFSSKKFNFLEEYEWISNRTWYKVDIKQAL